MWYKYLVNQNYEIIGIFAIPWTHNKRTVVFEQYINSPNREQVPNYDVFMNKYEPYVRFVEESKLFSTSQSVQYVNIFCSDNASLVFSKGHSVILLGEVPAFLLGDSSKILTLEFTRFPLKSTCRYDLCSPTTNTTRIYGSFFFRDFNDLDDTKKFKFSDGSYSTDLPNLGYLINKIYKDEDGMIDVNYTDPTDLTEFTYITCSLPKISGYNDGNKLFNFFG